jgi:hypothetical protein
MKEWQTKKQHGYASVTNGQKYILELDPKTQGTVLTPVDVKGSKRKAMKKIWYFDNVGKKHTFEAEDHSIEGILKEFKTIDKYLSSLGIHHKSCGVEGMPSLTCSRKASDLPFDQSGKLVGWIAFYNNQRVEIKKSEAKDLWGAKQLAMQRMKVPKSKQGLVAIEPAYE